MSKIPRVKGLNNSGALLADPYGFISKYCRALGTDVFATRMLLRKTLCMTGPQAARLFYDPQHVMREGAPPLPLQKTLLGMGGTQVLDDEAHRHRKVMFLSLMTPQRIQHLKARVRTELEHAALQWTTLDRVVLYDALHPVLTRAVCDWAGVPVPDRELARRTQQFVAMYDGAGSAALRHFHARLARMNAERWLADLIARIRSQEVRVPEASAAYVIALHRDLSGNLLTAKIAAVELLNVIRPTVAVSVYIVFVAHALHACAQRGDTSMFDGTPSISASEEVQAVPFEKALEAFTQEVRRYYPFFPAVPAKTRHRFEWEGLQFPARTRAMLDLHGTNHDPRAWQDPNTFKAQRFLDWRPDPFTFIPQGGGHDTGHRCPGEWITLELMKDACEFFLHGITYTVPPQDLALDYSRLPALPRSRFVLSNVVQKRPADASQPLRVRA